MYVNQLLGNQLLGNLTQDQDYWLLGRINMDSSFTKSKCAGWSGFKPDAKNKALSYLLKVVMCD